MVISSLFNSLAIVCAVWLIFSESEFNRGWGWCLMAINIGILIGTLSGCTTNTVPRDTIVPAGAVAVSVPVPTCSADLSKSLFSDTHRPEVLPINKLTASDKQDYELVYQAYIQTIQILTEYSVALERDRMESQMQCKAIQSQVDTLNTKTPVIPVQQ